jgi:hypothetical protein
MEVSVRFRAFLVLCTMMISLSLFLFNDLMTIWSGAEAAWLGESLSPGNTNFLPLKLMKVLAQTQENFPFVPRISGAVLFLASIAGFYYIAKPYLGNVVVLLTGLVLGAGFMMPVLAKIATLDIWNFAFHFLAYFSLIRYVKKPAVLWQILFYLFMAIALLVQPVSALIFLLGSSVVLWWKHPQGSRLVKLNPWVAGVVFAVIFHVSGFLEWQNDWQLFAATGKDFGKYLLFNLIGVLPFIGFLTGGILDLFYKLKRGEEMSLIIFVLILFSILAQSPVLQAGLALLITKQMLLFYDERYPFKSWVRAITIVHLIFAFGLSVVLMLGGFSEFGGLGFRSGLIFSFMYWAVGVIGVFGQYGTQRTMLIGGPVASGVLTMLIFWMQLYPLVESRRNIPKRIVESIESIENPIAISAFIITDSTQQRYANLPVYLGLAFPDTKVASRDYRAGKQNWETGLDQVWLNNLSSESDTSDQVLTVEGWNDRLKPERWTIRFPGPQVEN